MKEKRQCRGMVKVIGVWRWCFSTVCEQSWGGGGAGGRKGGKSESGGGGGRVVCYEGGLKEREDTSRTSFDFEHQ